MKEERKCERKDKARKKKEDKKVRIYTEIRTYKNKESSIAAK